MKPTLIILITALWLSCLPAMGEIVLLQSGKTMTGEILLQNDEIVILRDAEGRRFQFPRSEVQDISLPAPADTIVAVTQQPEDSKGNCALRLDLCGGALFIPTFTTGGTGSIDLQIGTRHIGNQDIFLGGSVGYQAAVSNQVYHFMPLMMVVSVPLMQGRHAPEVGAALGYGFALKQPSAGGMTAKLDISWRYTYNTSSVILIGVQARFQQAQLRYTEIIDNKEYTAELGKNCVSVGMRLALQF